MFEEQRANVDGEIAMRKLAFKATQPPKPNVYALGVTGVEPSPLLPGDLLMVRTVRLVHQHG
jgi:hypothetical protein